MTGQTERIASALMLAAGLLLSLRLLRRTKYRRASAVAPLSSGDVALGLLLSGCASLAAAHSLGLGLAAAGLALLVLWILWLDAALYGCFTFELGLHGVRDVVLSNLVAEMVAVRWARRTGCRVMTSRPASIS